MSHFSQKKIVEFALRLFGRRLALGDDHDPGAARRGRLSGLLADRMRERADAHHAGRRIAAVRAHAQADFVHRVAMDEVAAQAAVRAGHHRTGHDAARRKIGEKRRERRRRRARMRIAIGLERDPSVRRILDRQAALAAVVGLERRQSSAPRPLGLRGLGLADFGRDLGPAEGREIDRRQTAAQLGVVIEGAAGPEIALLRQLLGAVPDDAADFLAGAVRVPRHALEAGKHRLVAEMDRRRFRHDAMRRSAGHIDEIAKLGIDGIDRGAAKLDAGLAGHLHDHRIGFADQEEWLRDRVAAQMHLRINAKLQHRHLVVGTPRRRFLEGVEDIFALHGNSLR